MMIRQEIGQKDHNFQSRRENSQMKWRERSQMNTKKNKHIKLELNKIIQMFQNKKKTIKVLFDKRVRVGVKNIKLNIKMNNQ